MKFVNDKERCFCLRSLIETFNKKFKYHKYGFEFQNSNLYRL